MNVFRRCMAAVRSLFTGRVGNAGDAQTAFEEGKICFDRGDVVSAIAKFSDAIRFNPELCDTYYQRGIAYLNTRDLDKAIADFTGAIRLNPNSAEAYFNRGFAHDEQGEFAKAIADYTDVIRLRPDLAEAYLNRAAAHSGREEFEDAIADCTIALRLKADFAEGHYYRGVTYRYVGEYDKAIQDFTEAIATNPEYLNAYLNRGFVYSLTGERRNAIADFTEAIRLNPEDGASYSHRGLAYGACEEHFRAAADFTEAIRRGAECSDVYFNRGVANQALGEWELAIVDFGEALRLNPEYVEAHSARGVVYAKRAQFQEAITEFTEAIRLGPADGGLYHNRARAYKRLGEATASAADFSKAQELGYPPGVRSATTVLEPGVRFAFKASDDPTAKGTDQPDPGGAAMRERSMAKARAAGFTPLDPLPTAGHRAFVAGKLRPKEEIAGRLMALQAVVLWVTAAEADVSTAEVREFASRNRLETLMTPEERQIFNSSRPRAAERHRPTIGWRMENMWPLAWLLGFKWAPTTTHGQVSGDIMTPMFKGFLPRLSSSIADFAENVNLRRLEEVAQLEDEFYCTHNAVRSAQLGERNRVPDGFDPINDGGVIHERRHSLSWVLSPGVPWDETDLST